ncbi:MAG: tetratricopeptide repeat protein [bacterium]|nr:tetratricopeptide repeat protein [bacterium]
MKTEAKSRRRPAAGPAPANVADAAEAPRPRRPYARWRAVSLSLVYLVFAAHIIHWKITGHTLAPLELNEVMYTLELGIVTAGFLFMCFLALGTLVFGRFFCSWACHIMVLQDLCAWMLRKMGIRRKPIRSRLLLLVPPLTAAYMFLWPQIVRAWHAGAFPEFHWATDRDGWASLVTSNFWRNLPGPAVIVLTFLVCGFVIVYLLGSRTFCTYVCPYGAIFALADRFSPGRIKVSEACVQCGTCTNACTSGIRVHEEVKQHGMIVNPACMKDLDCMAACPQDALSYGLSKPSLFKSVGSGGRFGSRPYDFSWIEEMLVAGVFVTVLLSFRGLYSRIPFLLSLALGGVFGYLTVLTVRLITRPQVSVSTVGLKLGGRLTRAGMAFAGQALLLTALVGHSAFVRYHEYRGLRHARAMHATEDSDEAAALAATARNYLTTADRWGLIANERVERAMMATATRLDNPTDLALYALRVLDRRPDDLNVRLQLAQMYLDRDRPVEAKAGLREVIGRGRGLPEDPQAAVSTARQSLADLLLKRRDFNGAAEQLQATLKLDPDQAPVHAQLGSVLAELSRFDEAIATLTEAVRLDPELGAAHYNLGVILAHQGRFAEAISSYEQAVRFNPDDADLRNNLGFALMRTDQLDAAREQLEQALTINPDSADAHFNLGRIHITQNNKTSAAVHFQAAARLDPRYARLLTAPPPAPPSSTEGS